MIVFFTAFLERKKFGTAGCLGGVIMSKNVKMQPHILLKLNHSFLDGACVKMK